MIDKNTIDRIMNTADIVDVISDFVTLRRRGANFVACCPFHNEKTPSFYVSRAKGIFKCFGCGKAGNVVGFVMEHEHLTYVEALKYIGKKYGIEVADREETEEDRIHRFRNESLLIVSDYAQKFYQDILLNDPMGKAIGLSYFKEKRGFTDKTIERFGLGFSLSTRNSSHKSFSETALDAGYKKDFLIGTGLSLERNDGTLIDKFYDRAMFPIKSISGRVIAFGGRTLQTDKHIAKYVNSPETEIYHKSDTLYGIFQAKNSISKLQKCYLVEGYADVISFNQSGIENVIASSGTSLTEGQIRLIKRFTDQVTILYDGDAAGIKASIRGIDMLLKEGMKIKVVLLSDGDDPDSFARKHTLEEIQEYLENHERDFIEFKYDLYAEEINNDPLKRSKLIHDILKSIALISDTITRQVYIEETSSRLDMGKDILAQEVFKLRKAINPRKYTPIKTSQTTKVQPIEQKLDGISMMKPFEKEILYWLVKYGEYPLYSHEDHLVVTDSQKMKNKIENNCSVSDIIYEDFSVDDITFKNPEYKKIFDLYYQIKQEIKTTENINDNKDLQEIIQKKLINHPDPEVSNSIISFFYQKDNLNIKSFKDSLIPDENTLERNVPKSLLIYKTKYLELIIKKDLQKLKIIHDEKIQNQSKLDISNNYTTLKDDLANKEKIIINHLTKVIKVKTKLTKELNRIN
ncbi:MAG: DNA primase [Bacteroidales bacterium]